MEGEGKRQHEQKEEDDPHGEPRIERKPVHSGYSPPGDHRKRIGKGSRDWFPI